jgi:hypothetical protein
MFSIIGLVDDLFYSYKGLVWHFAVTEEMMRSTFAVTVETHKDVTCFPSGHHTITSYKVVCPELSDLNEIGLTTLAERYHDQHGKLASATEIVELCQLFPEFDHLLNPIIKKSLYHNA